MQKTRIICLLILMLLSVTIGYTQSVSFNQNNVTFKIGADGKPIRQTGSTAIIKTTDEFAFGTIDISFDDFFYPEILEAQMNIFEDKGSSTTYVTGHTYDSPGLTLPQLDFTLETNKKYKLSLLFKFKENGNVWESSEEIKLEFETDPLQAFAGSDRTINCGVSTTIGGNPAATGGYENYTYSWTASTGESVPNLAQPIVTPTRSTTYTLTVTDTRNGQTATDQVRVNVRTITTPVITGLARWARCNNTKQDYNVSFDSEAAKYEWSTTYGYITKYYYTNGKKTGVQISTTSINLPIAQPMASNSRTTVVRAPLPDPNSGFTITCKVTSKCGSIKTATKYIEFYYPLCGILIDNDFLAVNKDQQLKVSPNPVSIQQPSLSIAFDNAQHSNVWVEVYDMQGVKVLGFEDKSKEGFNKNIDVNELKLKPGLYIVRVSNGSETFQKRLFVQK